MAEPRVVTYREVFAVGEFRTLWSAQLCSVVGDQFARVALAVLVFSRTGSATLTALTYALTLLPGIIAGPLLSGLADRFPRRRLMITADIARACLVTVMAIPGMPLVVLCGLLVAVQMLAAPFDAARAAMLPAVFGDGRDDRYVVANTVSNLTYQGAQLVGFAAGGVLTVGINPSAALLLDAVTFALSAALLRWGVVDRPAGAAETSAGLAGWARRISAGAHLVWADRRLRMLVMVLCVPAFPVVVEGLAVPYAVDLAIASAAVGLLFAAPAAGTFIGMMVITRLPPSRRLRLMPPLAVASCAILVLCLFRPGLVGTIALWGLSGVCTGYFVVANAEFVRTAPDSQRGQAVGLAATACRASQGLGVLAGGVVADLVQPAVAVAVAGAVGAAYASWAGWGWRRVHASAGAGAPADGSA